MWWPYSQTEIIFSLHGGCLLEISWNFIPISGNFELKKTTGKLKFSFIDIYFFKMVKNLLIKRWKFIIINKNWRKKKFWKYNVINYIFRFFSLVFIGNQNFHQIIYSSYWGISCNKYLFEHLGLIREPFFPLYSM